MSHIFSGSKSDNKVYFRFLCSKWPKSMTLSTIINVFWVGQWAAVLRLALSPMRLNNFVVSTGNVYKFHQNKFHPCLIPCIPMVSTVFCHRYLCENIFCVLLIVLFTLPVIVFWMNFLYVLDINSSLWAKTEPDSCHLYPWPSPLFSFNHSHILFFCDFRYIHKATKMRRLS